MALAPPSLVGVVSALVVEGRSLTRREIRPGERVQLADGLLLVVCGVGQRRAARCAEALIEHGARTLLSWGVAGGLEPSLAPGTILLPTAVADCDGQAYPCDPCWHRELRRHLGNQRLVDSGLLAQHDAIVATPAEKARLWSSSGAVAVDMESGALAAVASRSGIPFVSVRAIADGAQTVIPVCARRAVDEAGVTRRLALLRALARRPWELPQLLRVGRDFLAARRALGAAAAALRAVQSELRAS